MNKNNENPSNIVPGSNAAGETDKDAKSPLQHDTRREFVRKSLAAGIIASQPTILAGLIRADGGGNGGQTTTSPWGATTTGGQSTTGGYTTYATTATPQVRVWTEKKLNVQKQYAIQAANSNEAVEKAYAAIYIDGQQSNKKDGPEHLYEALIPNTYTRPTADGQNDNAQVSAVTHPTKGSGWYLVTASVGVTIRHTERKLK